MSHVAKICVARVSLLPGRATRVGRGHVHTALMLVSASAESAHAPHSSHTRTNEGKRTGRHLPDEDCSGLTQSQRDSNRARTEFWCFPLSFPLGNAGTASRGVGARDEVPAFPNGKTREGTRIQPRRRSSVGARRMKFLRSQWKRQANSPEFDLGVAAVLLFCLSLGKITSTAKTTSTAQAQHKHSHKHSHKQQEELC